MQLLPLHPRPTSPCASRGARPGSTVMGVPVRPSLPALPPALTSGAGRCRSRHGPGSGLMPVPVPVRCWAGPVPARSPHGPARRGGGGDTGGGDTGMGGAEGREHRRTREGAEGTGRSGGTSGTRGAAGSRAGAVPQLWGQPRSQRWARGWGSLARAQWDLPGLSLPSCPNSPIPPIRSVPLVPPFPHTAPRRPLPARCPRCFPVLTGVPPGPPHPAPPLPLAPPPLPGRSVALLGGVSHAVSLSRDLAVLSRDLPSVARRRWCRRHGESGTGPGSGPGAEPRRLLKGVLQPGCAGRGGRWSPVPRCLRAPSCPGPLPGRVRSPRRRARHCEDAARALCRVQVFGAWGFTAELDRQWQPMGLLPARCRRCPGPCRESGDAPGSERSVLPGPPHPFTCCAWLSVLRDPKRRGKGARAHRWWMAWTRRR